jgi:hypothetical protein
MTACRHETGWPSGVSRCCGQPVLLGLVEAIAMLIATWWLQR